MVRLKHAVSQRLVVRINIEIKTSNQSLRFTRFGALIRKVQKICLLRKVSHGNVSGRLVQIRLSQI